MSKRGEVVLGWALIAISVIGWPASYIVPARFKEDFILGLSWLAIMLVALDFLKSARMHRDVVNAAKSD